MRILLVALCLVPCLPTAPLLADETADQKAVVAVVQKLFDAMATKDGVAIRNLALPGMSLAALRPDGQTSVTPVERFAETISAAQGVLLERMWDPQVQVDGNIATLWAPYDFHRDGKLTHCGIDVAALLKTAEGWKIGSLAYTMVQQGCASPR
jgi:hypothetical protein